MKTKEAKLVERKLEKSGRISPREVLEAYERTGLQPCVGWGDGEKLGCALTAVLGGHSGQGGIGITAAANRLMRARMGRFGACAAHTYRLGFVRGFDGGKRYDPDKWFGKGWRDGRRASRFVFGE